MYDSFLLCLYRKDPKKRNTGKRVNMPRGISPQKRRGIMNIMARRKNTVMKAATTRKPGTKVNSRTTRKRSNKITGNAIKCGKLFFLSFRTTLYAENVQSQKMRLGNQSGNLYDWT
jgi:hypothetical protein